MLSRGSAYIAHPVSNHFEYVESLAAVTAHYPDDMRKRNPKGVTSFAWGGINNVRFLQKYTRMDKHNVTSKYIYFVFAPPPFPL